MRSIFGAGCRVVVWKKQRQMQGACHLASSNTIFIQDGGFFSMLDFPLTWRWPLRRQPWRTLRPEAKRATDLTDVQKGVLTLGRTLVKEPDVGTDKKVSGSVARPAMGGSEIQVFLTQGAMFLTRGQS